MKRACLVSLVGALAAFCATALARAQQIQINPDVYNEMKFRYIGPVGNRATAVVGIPGNPKVYYVGAASGGILKSTDGGVHWDPIFDDQPVSSIGTFQRDDPQTHRGALHHPRKGSNEPKVVAF